MLISNSRKHLFRYAHIWNGIYKDNWGAFRTVWNIYHCVKSVHIRSYSGPYFPAFGLNTDGTPVLMSVFNKVVGLYNFIKKRLQVFSPYSIQIQTRITPNTDNFYAVCDRTYFWQYLTTKSCLLTIFTKNLYHRCFAGSLRYFRQSQNLKICNFSCWNYFKIFGTFYVDIGSGFEDNSQISEPL